MDNKFEEADDQLKITILYDEPSDKDLFGGNGHERTANSLVKTIAELSDIDGAIGLEGNWGAGKSTVLKLAERKLSNTTTSGYKYFIFTLDLWTTHTDNFRRAFLETLLSWSKKNELLDINDADKYLEIVRGKKQTITYSKVRQYNWLGLVFLALAPLFPIFYIWLSPFAFNSDLDGRLYSYIPFFVISLITFLYIALGFRACNIYKTSKASEKTVVKSLSRTFSVFSKDVDKETVDQRIIEEDPSTIQFEDTFREIVSKIQHTTDNRIIIVLDNIDRLPKDDIPNVWSSFRSILLRDEAIDNYPESTTTVIIPYDRKYLLAAFGSNADDETSLGFMSEDLIRKTFRRIFYVSPTVASDWKVFFQNKLEQAISHEFTEQTVYKLTKMLDYHFQELRVQPTPRQIINHVNELASLWQSWGDILDIQSLSIYTFLRAKLVEDPNLLKTDILNQRIKNVIGDLEWQRDIAALIFNVDKDHAYQALLAQDIVHLLPSPISDELRQLSEIKGFDSELVDVVLNNAAEWASESPELISKTIENLLILDLYDQILDILFKAISATLPTLANLKSKFDLSTYNGLIKLPQNLGKNHESKVIFDIIKWLNKNVLADDATMNVSGKQWYEFYSGLTLHLSSDELKKLNAKIDLPPYAALIIDIASISSSYSLFHRKELPIGLNELDDSIKNHISKNDELVLSVLKPLEDHLSANLISFIQTSYVNRLKENPTIPAVELEVISKILYFTFTSSIFKDRHVLLNEIITSGIVLWHLNNYYAERDQNLIHLSWMMMNHLGNISDTHFSNQPRHPHLGNISSASPQIKVLQSRNSYSDEEIDELVELTLESSAFSQWLLYAETATDEDNIFREVFKRLLMGLKFNTININSTITKYTFIRSFLNPKQTIKFLEKLSNWSGHISKAFSSAKCLEIPYKLLKDIDDFDVKSLNILVDETDNYLKSLSSDDWHEHLEKNSETLKLLINRQKLKPSLTLLVDNFRLPLINHAKKILDGSIKQAENREEWSYVLRSFRTNTLRGLCKDMLNLISNSVLDRDTATEFLINYNGLLPYLPEDSSSDVLFDGLLINLISSNDPQIKQILRDNSHLISKIYFNLSKDVKIRFDDALKDLRLSTDDDSIKEWTKELKKLTSNP